MPCCPYCDSEKVEIRSVDRMEQDSEQVIVVAHAFCRECGRGCYAIRRYSESGDCEMVRREDISKAVPKKRVLSSILHPRGC